MMKAKYIYILLSSIIGMIGCNYSEDELTPSDIKEYELIIPQGNAEYDKKIVNWHTRIGKYILYKFKPADVYFNVNSIWSEIYTDTIYVDRTYLEDEYKIKFQGGVTQISIGKKNYVLRSGQDSIGYPDGSWVKFEILDKNLRFRSMYFIPNGNFKVEQAELEYVERQLDLLEECFLNPDFYTDDILRSQLPLKIILGCKLKYLKKQVDLSTGEYKYTIFPIKYHTSFNNLIFSHGDNSITKLTNENKKALKEELNNWFIEQIKDRLSLDKFYSVTQYTNLPDLKYKYNELYDWGLISPIRGTPTLYNLKKNDLDSYIQMILENSLQKMEKEPKNGNYILKYMNGKMVHIATGVLHPKKDRKGLIKKKYDILINEFKRLGVNLQAIGNLYQID